MEDGPPPRRRRLDLAWDEFIAKSLPGERKTSAPRIPWDGQSSFGQFASLFRELAAAQAMSFVPLVIGLHHAAQFQRRPPALTSCLLAGAEKRAEDELVAELKGVIERIWHNALLRHVGPPSLAQIAGDAALITIQGTDGDDPEEKLCDALVKEHWVFAVDAASTAFARTCTGLLAPDEEAEAPAVEHVNGARAYIGIGERAAFLEERCKTAESIFSSLGRGAASSAVVPSWADLADMCQSLRAARLASDVTARRGDETSLELCSKPLYANSHNVLRPRADGELDDDQEVVSLASVCQQSGMSSKLFPEVARKRPRFGDVQAALAAFVNDALRAKRGGGITCDALRKSAQLGTFATGSYVDDDGKFRPLDRKLVDDAKRKLRQGEHVSATDSSNEQQSNEAAQPSTRALVVAGAATDEPAAKRQRGGAVLKLVKSARPPLPVLGPPPPRTAEEQHRSAAIDCARLELEAEAAEPRKQKSLIGAALPSEVLCEVRMRQLASAIVRRSLCRADDHMRKSRRTAHGGVHAYAALAWRLTLTNAKHEGFSTVHAMQVDANCLSRGTTMRPIPRDVADLKGRADANVRGGDVDGAVAHYTAAIASADHPALLVDRADALLQSGLPFSALVDAIRAFIAAPGWSSSRIRLAECLGATGDTYGVEALCELSARLDDCTRFGYTHLSRVASEAAKRQIVHSLACNFEAAKARGDTAFRSKQHVEAIEAYSCAIRVATHSSATTEARKLAAAYSNRAAAAAALGSHYDAMADGIAAAALAPDWVKGHVRVATALRAIRQPQEAIEAYFNALRLMPGDLDLNTGLCDAVEEYRAQRRS